MSAVSGWEIAIKASLGRLESSRDVAEAVVESGFEELPLRLSHSTTLRTLPPHHADPFDRMLLAQAISEGLTLVSRDRMLERYDLKVLRA